MMKRVSVARGATIVVTTCCVLVSAGAAVAAVAMTGNPQGIKLAKRVMRAFAHIPAYGQTEQHYFQIRSSSKRGTFSYLFGKAHRRGYVWASESATVALHNNRVLWWRDELRPMSGQDSPVEIVLNRRGRFSAFGGPRHHSCFTSLRRGSTLPYRIGGLGYSIGGRVSRPKYRGPVILLTYVYRWETHETAIETDTIDRSTKLVLSGKVTIYLHTSRQFAFEFNNTYPKTAPKAPRVKLCRG